MKAEVTSYKTVEKVVVEETTTPKTVSIEMDADVFVALYSHWSHAFNGYDGKNGIRDRVDKTMSSAWEALLPGVEYDYTLRDDNSTTRALAHIEKVLR